MTFVEEAHRQELKLYRDRLRRAHLFVEFLVNRLKECGEWPEHNECKDQDATRCLRCGLDADLDQMALDREHT